MGTFAVQIARALGAEVTGVGLPLRGQIAGLGVYQQHRCADLAGIRGYLAGRIIARDHRFRAAVCCEAVADLRLLDPASRRMLARWLGGDAGCVPQRWTAASPKPFDARRCRYHYRIKCLWLWLSSFDDRRSATVTTLRPTNG